MQIFSDVIVICDDLMLTGSRQSINLSFVTFFYESRLGSNKHSKNIFSIRYNGLLNHYNELLNHYNEILNRFNGLLNRFNGLLNRFNGLLNRFNGLLNH